MAVDAAAAPLIEVVLDALATTIPDDEAQASRVPPYPVAPAIRPHHDRLRAALTTAVDDVDPEHRTVLRSLADPSPTRATIDGALAAGAGGVHSGMGRRFLMPAELGDLAILAVSTGLVADPDVARITAAADARPEWSAWYGGLVRQVLRRHLEHGDVPAAERTIPMLARSQRWRGWRDVAAHHAANGDVAAFLAVGDRLDRRKQPHELPYLVGDLVRAVSVREGWRAGVELARRPETAAPASIAIDTIPFDGVADVTAFLEGEGAGVLGEQGEIRLLLDAVLRESPRGPEHDHPALGDVVDRIVALDHTASTQAMRSRDVLLVRTWPAIGDAATLRRVRAAIRTPRERAQLTVLARDVRGPETDAQPG